MFLFGLGDVGTPALSITPNMNELIVNNSDLFLNPLFMEPPQKTIYLLELYSMDIQEAY